MKIRFQHTGRLIASFMRTIVGTLTIEIEDRSHLMTAKNRPGLIWTFWHNRMFLIPYLHQSWLPDRPGCILSSPSGDGQIIADVCSDFGLKPVRGSSSRKGLSALMTLADLMRNGYDSGITPDGPRGPCYHLNPGPLKLAQLTGALILPIHVQYDRPFRFKSTWDQFLVPRPFSKVRIILDEVWAVERRVTEAAFEEQRRRIEEVMRREAVDYQR